uniref:Uncharacterized protein n=1 Tax=viral metagenome TaxID=1070528 RepID=A0A6H2A0H6_9ZZZZ
MTLFEFIKDLTEEMDKNKGWAQLEVKFCTRDKVELDYYSIYDHNNTLYIDIDT